jgi:MtN3 and saliva related transmembrane protein
MNAASLVGFLAAICTTTAYIPQVVRAWRTRSTHDLSLKMYVVMTTGTALWLLYGVIEVDWPLIAANAISLGLTLSILLLKFRYG